MAGASEVDDTSWLRWRQPATVVVLVALALAVLADLALWAIESGPLGPAEAASYGLGQAPATAVLSAAVAALVLSCHASPASSHVRALTTAALVVVGVAGVVAVVLSVLSALGPGELRFLLLVGELALATVPLVATGLLSTLRRGLPAAAGAVAPVMTAPPAPEPPPEPAPPPSQQPTWALDAATGAVWRTAGDAAAGSPASGWGTAGWSGWEAPPPEFDAPSPDAARSVPETER